MRLEQQGRASLLDRPMPNPSLVAQGAGRLGHGIRAGVWGAGLASRAHRRDGRRPRRAKERLWKTLLRLWFTVLLLHRLHEINRHGHSWSSE